MHLPTYVCTKYTIYIHISTYKRKTEQGRSYDTPFPCGEGTGAFADHDSRSHSQAPISYATTYKVYDTTYEKYKQ
jgi:hypothetical protein